jgi:subtilisin family serine protease
MARVNDPLFAQQWALELINAPAAWEITQGSADVVIAILEQGFDVEHPDLKGQFLPGWDLWDDDATLEDSSQPRKHKDSTDHGTHVSGIIAAKADNGIGIAGVAPECRILPVRIDAYDDAAIARGIRFAVDNGARVINLSNVGYMYNIKHGLPTIYSAWTPPHSEELPEACLYAQQHNVLIVNATGGNQAHNVAKYPALCPGVVNVASADKNGRMADFSDYGDLTEVAAPSGWRAYDLDRDPSRRILPLADEDVMAASLGSHPQEEYGVLSTVSGAHGGYVEWSGGCMAIPHVAGLAGLVWSRHPGLTAEQVRMVVRNTANQPSGSGWNPYMGHGLIDAFAAVSVERLECDLEIADVVLSERSQDLGCAHVTLINRGVLDARDVAVMVYDGPLDEGGGIQLGHVIVPQVLGREDTVCDVLFRRPEGKESLVVVCDPRGQLSAQQGAAGLLFLQTHVRMSSRRVEQSAIV